MEFEKTDKNIWSCGNTMKYNLKHYNGDGYYVRINKRYKKIYAVYPIDGTEDILKVFYYKRDSLVDGIESVELNAYEPVYLPKRLGFN